MESENNIIRDRAKFLAKNSKPSEIPNIALLVLYDLELPLHYRGFGYLQTALLVASREPIEIVLKDIFNEVGKLYTPEVKYHTMDGSIRDAIVDAWENRRNDKWRYYFPAHLIAGEEAPSNAEFIAAIAYFLEMCRNICKEEDYAKQ